MKTNQTLFFVTLLLTCLFIAQIPLASSEVLHNWHEPHPEHSWGENEQVFNTFTSKYAALTEENLGGFGNSWKLTASATASAGAVVPLPDRKNRSREWDASGLVKATGDKDTVDPHSGDGLPVYVRGPEGARYDHSEKVIASTDNSTTARTVRKTHIIYYIRPLLFGDVEQRSFDVSTNGDKSRSSISPSTLTANPWASSRLEVKRKINLNNNVKGSPFTSTTPAGGGENQIVSPPPSPTPTPTPTDGTPDCPDCTSHCSSPCSCTNLGTCNGSVSYHPCGEHLTSVSGDHSYGTYTFNPVVARYCIFYRLWSVARGDSVKC